MPNRHKLASLRTDRTGSGNINCIFKFTRNERDKYGTNNKEKIGRLLYEFFFVLFTLVDISVATKTTSVPRPPAGQVATIIKKQI